MDLEKLTSFIELFKILDKKESESEIKNPIGLSGFVGKKVIIRTYSAGVHYGLLQEKHGDEVILKNSRRLYYWVNKKKHISLSEIAKYGLGENSKVCDTVDIWLKAIEIIPCTQEASENIESYDVYQA